METIKIAWMYPDILNLHGDRGNLMALQRVAKLMGVEAEITRIENYEQAIDYEAMDLLFFTSGEVKSVAPIVKRLEKDADALKKYVEAGKMIVAIGTSGAIFANHLMRRDGSSVEGLRYLDMDVVDGMPLTATICRSNSITSSTMKSSAVRFRWWNSIWRAVPVGTTVYGRGNRLEGKAEGAIYKNVMMTNLLGPALVKNPWFAEALLREILKTNTRSRVGKLPDENLWFGTQIRRLHSPLY